MPAGARATSSEVSNRSSVPKMRKVRIAEDYAAPDRASDQVDGGHRAGHVGALGEICGRGFGLLEAELVGDAVLVEDIGHAFHFAGGFARKTPRGSRLPPDCAPRRWPPACCRERPARGASGCRSVRYLARRAPRASSSAMLRDVRPPALAKSSQRKNTLRGIVGRRWQESVPAASTTARRRLRPASGSSQDDQRPVEQREHRVASRGRTIGTSNSQPGNGSPGGGRSRAGTPDSCSSSREFDQQRARFLIFRQRQQQRVVRSSSPTAAIPRRSGGWIRSGRRTDRCGRAWPLPARRHPECRRAPSIRPPSPPARGARSRRFPDAPPRPRTALRRPRAGAARAGGKNRADSMRSSAEATGITVIGTRRVARRHSPMARCSQISACGDMPCIGKTSSAGSSCGPARRGCRSTA